MIKINKLVLAIALTLSASPLLAAHWECGEHVRDGIPSESDQLLCREGYAAGYNYQNKVSDWVSYQMTDKSAQGKVKRKNAFAEDKEIQYEFRATLADYKETDKNGLRYDRGHQAPAADMAATNITMKQSFLLSNMTPQLPELNQKAWRVLEEKTRKWAIARKDIQVITGPIFYGSEDSIGNGVRIPSEYFKIVLDHNNMEAIAFILPQENIPPSEIANYRVSVHEVEEKTNLDFFSDLSQEQQDELEADVSPMWE
ncbi:DNA/RNA non-specific endonuclease [Aeromonas finlandensis]|uniref:DNA/RNA non-specific endonuclease n=1 Tax=Aeromonas finlandensis TaxID=1543375 RepID=UPI00051BAABF|nr:DNA/RNA non-specific endonuclease [Aeromonas finlandensis]